MVIDLGTDEHLTAAGWIFFIVLIAIAAVAVIGPIVTVINWHREKDGKVSKGKVRNIIIVNKREIDHDFYSEGYRASLYARSEPTGRPDGIFTVYYTQLKLPTT
ncbi:MAG: hypothetical protein K2J77_08025 [Oscillospiraceae bacterium]|nr:hypothetical protein [Oscillospiraceae bacterium]